MMRGAISGATWGPYALSVQFPASTPNCATTAPLAVRAVSGAPLRSSSTGECSKICTPRLRAARATQAVLQRVQMAGAVFIGRGAIQRTLDMPLHIGAAGELGGQPVIALHG